MPRRVREPLRDEHPLDDSFRERDGRIGEGDVAFALLGSTEDACFIFLGTAEAPRLVATAVRAPRVRPLLSTARVEVPDDVKEMIRTGIPRRLTWPAPDSSGAVTAHRSWRIAESLHPCHGLVVPLDTESAIVGAARRSVGLPRNGARTRIPSSSTTSPSTKLRPIRGETGTVGLVALEREHTGCSE